MIEKRKYIRIPERLRIFYEIIPGAKTGEQMTRDISHGGIRFLIRDFLSKDSRLKIRITFKTFFSLEALVRVVWIREMPNGEEFEVGAQFIDMPKEAEAYLINYIETLSSTRNKKQV
ncbi:MAG TPA: PilZ domain-containing protein [Candidatus Omnitrophota bacterium]|nr:PilZ domain-containing protein [Candidatus Omnitrophota bacterium]HPD84744.1 PilZ domain-containing protein [Candidatus Omnitrophota bacterium]HRZ03602.1 PilZ domain-containing protein [Candidatus Omnitrophota bacterium]